LDFVTDRAQQAKPLGVSFVKKNGMLAHIDMRGSAAFSAREADARKLA